MKKTKPLNQVCSIGAYAPNRTSKLLNKSENDDSILGRLIEFASSVPDFVPICTLFHCCFFEKWQFKSNFAPSKPKTMTTTKKRVAAFDVLKGIAIYLVVMGHVLTITP